MPDIMTERKFREIQHDLNQLTNAHPDLDYTPLIVDGDKGQLMNKRIRQAKWLMGFESNLINDNLGSHFLERLKHPNLIGNPRGATHEEAKRSKERRARRRRDVRRNKIKAFLKPGVGTFDGKPVAKCAIPILQWCRANGWNGRLVSGWRDPKYSQSLCYQLCGRPSCPGTCAGLASNHVGSSPAKFAMDVSDYINFGHIVAQCPLRPHVHNALSNDRVHFSPTGN